MNTKILLSLSVIAAVVAIAIGGTVAYFSDVETSTGNTFTAGTLDLAIDVDGVWYGDEPEETVPAFFNQSDIKPGTSGEKTISFHVTNDAWLCAYTKKTTDDDVSCTEPEAAAGDTTCGAGEDGELDEYLDIVIWFDEGSEEGWQCGSTPKCEEDPTEGDNILQERQYNYGGEWVLWSGKAKDLPPLLRRPDGKPFNPKKNEVSYMGIKWSVDKGVGNIIQSDKLVVDAILYAEQQKNNPDFTCPATP